jgi:hypothetical protein
MTALRTHRVVARSLGTRTPGLLHAIRLPSSAPRSLAERHVRALVLRPRGDAQPEVVVGRILVPAAVDRGLLSKDLEQPAAARGS